MITQVCTFVKQIELKAMTIYKIINGMNGKMLLQFKWNFQLYYLKAIWQCSISSYLALSMHETLCPYHVSHVTQVYLQYLPHHLLCEKKYWDTNSNYTFSMLLNRYKIQITRNIFFVNFTTRTILEGMDIDNPFT